MHLLSLLFVTDFTSTGGRLEEALSYYKRSKEFGVERAAMHIRNVRHSADIPQRFIHLDI